jgi:hypothetical protein
MGRRFVLGEHGLSEEGGHDIVHAGVEEVGLEGLIVRMGIRDGGRGVLR